MNMYDIVNFMSATEDFKAKASLAEQLKYCIRTAKIAARSGEAEMLELQIAELRGMRSMLNAINVTEPRKWLNYREFVKIESLLWKIYRNYR